ncbi:ArsR/SmtB family transcription factor [Marinobacter fonticola]|uniref:ArsR/SmtB family transcription factor n=1 Tax=Marinobacter fonticola TaxID=2603215 RepID=UPI0011E86EB4|nr:metalloregulator ArsR/SmtB family transcription factor [Marinobacter fonticola]
MNNLAEVPTPSSALDSLAAVYKASGDPLRLEILRVLQRDTFGVLELSQIFEMRQSGMSHHLKVLSKAGLLEPQREGNAIFYRRPLQPAEDSLESQALQQLFATIDQAPLQPHRAAAIDAIRHQRSEQSKAFFARYVDEFREHQELIAEFERYADPVAQLIRSRVDGHFDHVLEVGPGEGGFLPALSQLAHRVVAVDNSDDMLRRAKSRCEDEGLSNIELIAGETDTLLSRGDTFDLIVANMVMHHVPSPADIFVDAAALLKDGGVLVISDLCSHDQNWVKANCGDLWLGFEPEELSAWAQDAGLATGETLFIGLRNGFQIQVREFWKPFNAQKNPQTHPQPTLNH